MKAEAKKEQGHALWGDAARGLLEAQGFVVVPSPFPPREVEACMRAIEELARASGTEGRSEVLEGDSQGNHCRLPPQIPGSYWSQLDHSLPFLKLHLHEKILDIAEHLTKDADFFYRNGGINELGSGRAFPWHRDTEDEYFEFMHYLSVSTPRNGCLRVVPGSHAWSKKEANDFFDAAGAGVKKVSGFPSAQLDVQVPGEISLEVGPDDLVIRHSRLLHATWQNSLPEPRVMHHWLFRGASSRNHRFRFEERLRPELIAALSAPQKRALWLGRGVEIDPVFRDEYEREQGKVWWSL